jgi:hypothetical protein
MKYFLIKYRNNMPCPILGFNLINFFFLHQEFKKKKNSLYTKGALAPTISNAAELY